MPATESLVFKVIGRRLRRLRAKRSLTCLSSFPAGVVRRRFGMSPLWLPVMTSLWDIVAPDGRQAALRSSYPQIRQALIALITVIITIIPIITTIISSSPPSYHDHHNHHHHHIIIAIIIITIIIPSSPSSCHHHRHHAIIILSSPSSSYHHHIIITITTIMHYSGRSSSVRPQLFYSHLSTLLAC
jgi:hypothetical protein